MFLVEGDSKFIIQDLQVALERHNASFSVEDRSLQPVFDRIIDILRDLEDAGIKVLLRHRPRRFNKVADQLTWKARREQMGTFSDRLLQTLIAERYQFEEAGRGSMPWGTPALFQNTTRRLTLT